LKDILGYRKKVIIRNLGIINSNSSPADLKKMVDDYYSHLADLILETMLVLTSTKEEIYPKVRFKNLEKFEEIYASGNNATILISHIGNWELFCQWAPLFIPRLQVVILYTAMKSRFFNSRMLQYRQRFGANLVSTKSILELYRIQKTKKPCINLFAIDQNPGDPENQYWMHFFDKKVPVISGAEKFAQSTKQACYFLKVEKEMNYYFLELIEMTSNPSLEMDVTKEQMRLLEENIRINPALWLLSHNRFKHHKSKS
jgi:KDO2-lipid IV(A) lauroyltransferase